MSGPFLLRTNAAVGSTFVGWGGASSGSGTGPCTLNLTENTEVSAQFEVLGAACSFCPGGMAAGWKFAVAGVTDGTDCTGCNTLTVEPAAP